ncbi:MAG TPA: peptidase S41, partial [Alphaproteobacteria bacterium]|nr:peptidase S41 [Alphaproteobacteria bacterium]
MERSNALYLVVLQSGTVSPLAKESDEETPGDGASESEPEDEEAALGDEPEEPPARVALDLEGLEQRIVALPLDPAVYAGLAPGKRGQLYYLKAPGSASLFGTTQADLYRFDLDEREETMLLEGVDRFALTPDGAKLLAKKGDAWLIADASKPVDASEGHLDLDAVRVRVDPRAEWRQIFDEAWRINRDYFYDPGMHGADWPAMRTKYEQLLPHLATRRDLNRVLQWMSSELAVGHHRVAGGDLGEEPDEVPGGLLGADYEVADGRYRFKRVYGGLNWNPGLRSPLTEPGVEVRAGELLLAVDGVDLRPPENLYARFENTAGRIVRLTVGPRADGEGSRTVDVVPVEDEADLRNRAWVEGNIAKVAEATGGRVAYVHVPNTAGLGHTYFKRYFYPQAQKEAIIVDERYNGGGLVADYYIDILRRPFVSFWAMRYGADLKTPLASIQGPKVMLIDETAGSGGDLLPWMFRKLELGTLVGRPTWGGLVGILGFPVLMDGGYITAPNLAIWTPEEGWVVENVGVAPDIEVEQHPAAVEAGHDPQLERAIEVILEELPAEPPPSPSRPPYPVRARR